MNVLIIGGPRQGEWLELAAQGGHLRPWVDLLTGDTYRIRRITWAVEGPIAGVAGELFKLPIAVHPSLLGANEAFVVQMGLMQVIAKPHIDAFMREHAERQDMAEPELPPVPDTPAGIVDQLPGGGS